MCHSGCEEGLLFALHDGWELVEIADQDHLDASEREGAVGTVQAQKFIDAIEEVGADHGDLVDHDGCESFVEVLPFILAFLANAAGGHIGFEAEEGMDRLTTHVDGRHPRWRQDDHILFGVPAEVSQEGGDFPVPARPVTKTWRREFSISSRLDGIQG